MEAFRSFFERVVWQCAEAGLVDGRKFFVDANLVDGDASNNSVVDKKLLKIHLRGFYESLEGRLAEPQESTNRWRAYEKKNNRYISTTDPDAAVVNRGKAKLSCQAHRAVEGRSEVITATETTAGV
jgi:hypothetical protein